MKLETLDGEIIIYGDVRIRFIQSSTNRSETPTHTRYFISYMFEDSPQPYNDSIEITERQYNQIKEDMESSTERSN